MTEIFDIKDGLTLEENGIAPCRFCDGNSSVAMIISGVNESWYRIYCERCEMSAPMSRSAKATTLIWNHMQRKNPVHEASH